MPVTDRRSNDRRTMDQKDHDLLIEIRTKLDVLFQKVEDSTKSTGQRLEALTTGKASNDDVTDHESRLRSLEGWVWKAVGGVGALAVLATVLAIIQFVRK